MISRHQKQRIKKLESYHGISNLNYEYGFNVCGYIYIYQVDLSFFLGYIYVLEDGFKDLNKVNPKAAISLEMLQFGNKRGWLERQDGFKPLTLFRWDINIYIILDLSHGFLRIYGYGICLPSDMYMYNIFEVNDFATFL